MSNVVQEAHKALDSIEDLVPWRFNEVTDGRIETEVLGSFRNVEGYPILQPHPESMSMLVTDRRIIDFIVNAPTIIQNLLEIVDSPKEAVNKASKTD